MAKIKEIDLAKQLIKSFSGTDYEIYQEVTTQDGVVDIVLKYKFLWAIEVKLGMNLTVIAQARCNQQYFQYSSICVPEKAVNGKTFSFGQQICVNYGVGIFLIRKSGYVSEHLKAKLNRSANSQSIILCEKMKSYAEAGNSNGNRWTPFNQTVENLRQYVKEHPGCRLKDAISEIKHHYRTLSSAQNSIKQWIDTGMIKNISLNSGVLIFNENNKNKKHE